VTIIIGTHFSK